MTGRLVTCPQIPGRPGGGGYDMFADLYGILIYATTTVLPFWFTWKCFDLICSGLFLLKNKP